MSQQVLSRGERATTTLVVTFASILFLLLLAGCSGEGQLSTADRLAVGGSSVKPDRAGGGRGSPVDADGDGFKSNRDCDDADPLAHPGASELCGDGKDNDCDGLADEGCAPSEPAPEEPLPEEPLPEDPAPEEPLPEEPGPVDPSAPHAALTWQGPATCLACHEAEATEAHGSVHYQWQGEAPMNVSGPSVQGKLTNALNSYCGSTLGNWGACGNCHAGDGSMPAADPSPAELAKVDCLLCHQEAYRRTKVAGVFEPDTANMAITMDEAVRTVHRPTRTNCLQCHAKGGGGDNYKRGDLALAHGATGDRSFDVHMATTGADLSCQACHTTSAHRIAGRGSDLRVTDNAASMTCSTAGCHPGKDSGTGHSNAQIDKHVARVACQTCHIPTYARDASDTAASEATEMHRTWLASTPSPTGAQHPRVDLVSNVLPAYRFWNGSSDIYTLGEAAALDPATGAYPTARPLGAIDDPGSKLFPFKHKTAEQPLASLDRVLIALDTRVYFATGDAQAATRAGLVNMGLPDQPFEFIYTDTFQLLTHEVAPSGSAATCSECHGSTASRVDLPALGYALKGPSSAVCTQCHGDKRVPGFDEVHSKHVASRGYDCSWCHGFSRPERGLALPR